MFSNVSVSMIKGIRMVRSVLHNLLFADVCVFLVSDKYLSYRDALDNFF